VVDQHLEIELPVIFGPVVDDVPQLVHAAVDLLFLATFISFLNNAYRLLEIPVKLFLRLLLPLLVQTVITNSTSTWLLRARDLTRANRPRAVTHRRRLATVPGTRPACCLPAG
jgi:hypothetical protein